MKKREDQEKDARQRIVDDNVLEDQEDDLLTVRADLATTLRPDYSWVDHFCNLHPGWQFMQFDDIPWTPLGKKLEHCRLAYIGMAGTYLKGQKPFQVSPSAVSELLRRQRFRTRGDWSFREIPRDASSADLLVAHPDYNRRDAEEDINCVFPIDRLREIEAEAVIGSLHETLFSLMDFVPESQLFENNAARQITDKLLKAQVDVVFLSPGSVLGHQNMALLQRHLEARGLPTLSLTLCPDITEHIGVPRAVCLYFPLGNVFGAALEVASQYRILRDALMVLDDIQEPGTIVELPYEWINPPG